MELYNDEYINKLEKYLDNNKQTIISLMITSLASKYACKQPRDKFLLSQQQNKDSSHILKHSEDYLNCHGKTLKSISNVCNNQYKDAYRCLDKQNNLDVIPFNCVNFLEDVIQCSMKH